MRDYCLVNLKRRSPVFKSGYIAVLLVALMATCPLCCISTCFACDCDVPALGNVGNACDDHDHHESPRHDHSDPTNQHDHGDCVCKGALPVMQMSLDKICQADSFLTSLDLAIEPPKVTPTAMDGCTSAGGFWAFATGGASLCVVTSCWLI